MGSVNSKINFKLYLEINNILINLYETKIRSGLCKYIFEVKCIIFNENDFNKYK